MGSAWEDGGLSVISLKVPAKVAQKTKIKDVSNVL